MSSLATKKSDKVKAKEASSTKRPCPQVSSGSSKKSKREEEGPVVLYEAEKIVARKPVPGHPGKYEYQIKWTGYPDSDNSWEPEYRLLKTYAGWVSDFNRAEDEQIKFRDLKEIVKIMMRGCKAPPEAFAGVDVTGLGVEVPGMGGSDGGTDSAVKIEPEEDNLSTGTGDASEEDPYQEFDSGSSIYSEMDQVTNDVTLPLGASDAELGGDNNQDLVNENSHGTEDLIQPNGPAAYLEVMEGGSEMEMPEAHANPPKSVTMDKNQNQAAPTKPGKDPVITSASSIPNSDMFAINQELVKENTLLKSELEEKEKRMKELDAELQSERDSRRLMETKWSQDKNGLKDALHTVTKMEKDLQSMEGDNTLLKEQLKDIHRDIHQELVQENTLLKSNLEEKDKSMEKLDAELHSLKDNMCLIETKLFFETNELKEMQRENDDLTAKVTERDGGISTLEQELESLNSNYDYLMETLRKERDRITALERTIHEDNENLAQLQKALNEVQHNKSKLGSKVTALTSDNDQLFKKLAEKSTRVSDLEGELKHLRATNQQQKDNLMRKDKCLIALQREIEIALNVSQSTPTPNQMESPHKNLQ